MNKIVLQTTGHEEEYTAWWMEQQKETQDETVVVGGMEIFVAHDVFSPKLENTNSVDMLLRNFPKVRGKRVLDVGTGTGVLAIKAAMEGAKEVVATDVTKSALENARRNIENTKTGDVISVVNQERFEDLGKAFDVILMNIIFAHSPEDPETKEKVRIESLGLHKRLIGSLSRLLVPGGKVVLGFASFGDIETLSEILNRDNLRVSVMTEEKFEVNWYTIIVENIS